MKDEVKNKSVAFIILFSVCEKIKGNLVSHVMTRLMFPFLKSKLPLAQESAKISHFSMGSFIPNSSSDT